MTSLLLFPFSRKTDVAAAHTAVLLSALFLWKLLVFVVFFHLNAMLHVLSVFFYDGKKSNQSQGFHHEMAQEQNWLSLATMRSYICILCLFVHLFVVDGVWICEPLFFLSC